MRDRAARRGKARDLTVLAIPLFVGTMAVEHLLLRRRALADPDEPLPAGVSNAERPLGYEPRDTAASLAMGIGYLLIGAGTSAAMSPLADWLYRHRLARWGGPDPKTHGSGLAAGALALLVWDFLFYWEHRLSHERRVMWAAHVNHHSSRRFNLSTALRQSWTGVVGNWVFLPMLTLGFSPQQIARAGELNLLVQYWPHTELVDRMPRWVETIFNTASHHRVHHGSNPQYLDRNYGGILIVWDRLFGTFEPERERVRYGLTTDIDTYNPLRVAFHEWAAIASDLRAADSWRERLGHLLGPPGWRPQR